MSPTVAALAPDVDIVTPWLADYRYRSIAELTSPACLAAERLAAGHPAIVDLQPGNGFRYLMICSLHHDPVLPGHLLVALPEFYRCLLLDPEGMHVPDYIGGKVGDLGPQHVAFLAAFTTLLSAALRVAH